MVPAMHPGRTFNVLLTAGILLMLLMGTAAVRLLWAGSPTGWTDLSCLFLPTKGDVGIHLITYALVGTIIWGTLCGLVSWWRQWSKARRLTKHLASRALAEETRELLASQPSLKGRVYIVDSDAPLCFCAGLLSPRIYLSRAVVEKLAPEELEALLLHEECHLESRDPLKVLLGRWVVSVLFFVPILRELYLRYLTSKEIAADRKAIENQGNPNSLAGALAKLIIESQGDQSETVGVRGVDSINQRIDHLTGQNTGSPRRFPLRRLATSLVIVFIMFGALVLPVETSHAVAGSAESAAASCRVAESSL